MKKINCIHYKGLCEFLFKLKENEDTTCKGCPLFLSKNQIIKLPIEITESLNKELTEYCYERCIDEL